MARSLTHLAATEFAGTGSQRDASVTAPAEVTLAIENMHCGGCLRKVEQALSATAGVAEARANLSSRRVIVRHDPARADAGRLIAALEAAGYRASELVASAGGTAAAADRDYMRYLAVAGFAATNIMLLSVSVWSGAHGDMPQSLATLFHWLSAIIALPAVAYAGQPFFGSAVSALRARRVNMDVPISLGVLLATAMSLYQTARGSEQVYFDAAVTLLFFLLAGRALDARMRSRAASAAANLLGLRAPTALLVSPDGTATRVATRRVRPGMRILTPSGEHFAADGRIVAGRSEIDASLVTGETRPQAVASGDRVYAGTVNLGPPVTIEAIAADDSSLIAEIARLLTAAEQGRASYVRLADRAARLYAPAVHALGLATFLGWLALGYGWEPALTAAIAVLIITCPCALALAVPAVQVAATSRLFAAGVLVKAPDALERLAEVDTIVLDKTGTITGGAPQLADAETLDAGLLERMAALAAVSRHPYAQAVVRAARDRGIAVVPAADVEETAGRGLVRRTSDGEERLGSADWCGIADAERDHASLWYRRGAGPSVPLPLDDPLRADASAVVAALRHAGFGIHLLSGDRQDEVARMAVLVGIAAHAGALLPSEKVARIAALGAEGRRVLMIGDGLNDAPSLAAAHASLSPSSAVGISQNAADAIIQGEALAPVVETLGVARETRRMALQNFALAIGYNVVFVPLAVLGLVTPLLAAIAMSASSVAVTANALRLRRKRLSVEAWRRAA